MPNQSRLPQGTHLSAENPSRCYTLARYIVESNPHPYPLPKGEGVKEVMKICIVGGTGNISQSMVRLLLEQGHEVVCFNRGQTDKVPGGVRLIQGDRHN